MKRILLFCLVSCFLMVMSGHAENMNLSAKSAILVERTSGQILYEQNSHERLPMASVTKVMTMLLGIEAVDSGKISMEDVVIVSEYASSMKGSRVFLSINEKISVSDLLKSIAVASGNDAAVCLAEHMAGSEANFVEMMNRRAKELGLQDTSFANCNGLPAENHYSSAYDLMVMSRELMKHESIRPFLTIWMDSLRDGTFTLANTNKLIRFYEGATGIKTGSTDDALFCISASALRDGMELITVILGAPTSKQRFADASSLLNMGFASYAVEQGIKEGETMSVMPVEKGVAKEISIVAQQDFSVVVKKEQKGQVVQKIELPEYITAPISKGQKIGEICFFLDGKQLGSTPLVSESEVKKAGMIRMYGNVLQRWINVE